MTKTPDVFAIPATVTERGQTTIPLAVRKMLNLNKGDQVVFRALSDGSVVIAKKPSCNEDPDPVLGKFLEFLASDIEKNPGQIRTMPRSLFKRARALVEGVEVNLDAELPDDNET